MMKQWLWGVIILLLYFAWHLLQASSASLDLTASIASMYTRTALDTHLKRRNQTGGTPTTNSYMIVKICSIHKVGTLWIILARFPSKTLISLGSSPTIGRTNIHGCPSWQTGPISAFWHVYRIKTCIHMYISIILKFIKILKMLKIKFFYLALPMLLLGGVQGLDHLVNPCRHTEIALVPVAIAPTRYRSHHRIHSALCLLLLDGGRCLPICSSLADVEIGLVEVWQGSTLVLSLEEGN